jgi:hypothetical protein
MKALKTKSKELPDVIPVISDTVDHLSAILMSVTSGKMDEHRPYPSILFGSPRETSSTKDKLSHKIPRSC